MAKSRRANAVVFGFDFQVNAAIVLMIENIEDLKSLRLEGNYEDIEIELENNQYILAQARLAYITVIEDTLKIKLPIILDSPSGKEVDQANIKLMMDILKRDFADHQIIIASIFNYDFDEAKIIEIKERLITENSL